MLALCHHVIVMVAAINCDKLDFRDYGVLGDDIFIADKRVADEYVRIMHELGLSINYNKTLQSSTLIEFAKT